MNNQYTHDKENREYYFAADHSSNDYTHLVDSKPSIDDLICELQLDAIGPWEPLSFQIDRVTWEENRQALQEYWRPFQPKQGILNDRDSILLYGMEGDEPTSPAGLSQIKKKLGYYPPEAEFNVPTRAVELLTSFKEVFSYFEPMGRTFLVKLNAGGFYPRHRDHIMLNRSTFRLIAFLGDAQDSMEWEVAGSIKTFLSNTVYYVDTRKMHRLCSWHPDSTMLVMNVPKTWPNVLKVLSKLKHY